MTLPKPDRHSEEAMTDRLVAEHERGEHEDYPKPLDCPDCEREEEMYERFKLGWKRRCT